MVVGSKKCAGTATAVLVDILYNSPGNRYTIVGRGTSSLFIEEHEAARTDIVEDIRSLGHLDHEGRLAYGDIVAGSYASEDFVH